MGTVAVFQLDQFITRFGARAFVETGTGLGYGVKFAQKFPFEQIYSIEIDAKQVEALKPTFANDPRVHLFAGQSHEVLRQILPEIKSNAIFWLDAHFPGIGRDLRDYQDANMLIPDEGVRLPLEGELRLIHDLRPGFHDVILIDDLRIYEDDNFEAGSLKKFNLGHIAKYDSQFLYTIFQDTHEVRRYLKDEGYFALFPRQPAG